MYQNKCAQHNQKIEGICCARKCDNRLKCTECFFMYNCQNVKTHQIILLKKFKEFFLIPQESGFSYIKIMMEKIRNIMNQVLKEIEIILENLNYLQGKLTKDYLTNEELLAFIPQLVERFDYNSINFGLKQHQLDLFINLSDTIEELLHQGKKNPEKQKIQSNQELRNNAQYTSRYNHKISLLVHEDVINCVAISPDSTILATSSFDQKIKLTNLTQNDFSSVRTYNLKTMEFQRKIQNPQVLCLAFSKDGKFLASGGKQQLLLWDQMWPPSLPSVVFNKEYLISGGQDIQVWNISTKQLFYTFKVSSQITGIVAHNQYIIAIQLNGQIQIWDLLLEQIVLEWKAHSKGLSLSLSPDRQSLVSSSIQGEISLWDLPAILKDPSVNPKEKNRMQDYYGNEIYSAKLSQDNKILVSCGSDNKSKVWDMELKYFFTIPHQTIDNPEQQRYNGEISNDMKYIIFGNMKYVDILVRF